MMLKKISLPLVCAVMLLTCSGCHSFKNNHRTVLDITNYFIDNGIQPDVVQPLFPFFGAEKAVSIKIKGKDIGIYKYNSNDPKQRLRLEAIINNKCVYVEGMKYPVLVNGSFMLLGYEVNPMRDRIIELFYAFGE